MIKNILLITLLFCSSINSFTKDTDKIQDLYSKAIDHRFTGEYDKARFILETIINEGTTNEFVYGLLTDIYFDYLSDLKKNNKQEIVQNAYPGIRENLLQAWKAYPKSEKIQNNLIKITWGIGDQEVGLSVLPFVLEQNPNHLLANYFTGVGFFSLKQYNKAIPYLERVVQHGFLTEYESIVFQSMSSLADIYYNNKQHHKAVPLYRKALEFSLTPELFAKLAVVLTHVQEFDEAIKFFSSLDTNTLNNELFDIYIAALFGSAKTSNINIMNQLLSSKKSLSPFSQAVAEYQLGRTQRAMNILKNETFIKHELPWSYHHLNALLAKRFNLLDQYYESILEQGIINVKLEAYQKSWKELTEVYTYLVSKKQSLTNVLLPMAHIKLQQKNKQDTFMYLTQFTKETSLPEFLLLLYFQMGVELQKYDDLQNYENKYFAKKISDYTMFQHISKICVLGIKQQWNAAKIHADHLMNDFSSQDLLRKMSALMVYSSLDDESLIPIIETQIESLIQKYGNVPIILNFKAYFLMEQNKNLELALELINKALSHDHDNNQAFLDTKAMILMKLDRMDEAQEIFSYIEQLLQQEEYPHTYREIFENLVHFYSKIGNQEKVEKYQSYIK